MPDKNENIPFTYHRGKVKFIGRTASDRRSVRIDTILHWVWKIIIALGFLLGVIYKIYSLS